MKKWNYSDLTAGQYKVSSLRLLTTNSLKTLKGLKRSILSGVLYLAPHTVARIELPNDPRSFGLVEMPGNLLTLCAQSSPGCRSVCLYRSGASLIYKKINLARIRKTREFIYDHDHFMADLVWDIAKIERIASKRNLRPAIRLNGTSDIAWETIPVEYDGDRFPCIMEAFPKLTFYDYTKRGDRRPLANYHLTFSRSEENEIDAIAMLEQGVNVAVVFYGELPKRWKGFKVVDGDRDDTRFLDQRNRQGIVIGLIAKATAKKDHTGFVVREEIFEQRIAC